MSLHPRVVGTLAACALLLGAASPAWADLTWFAGVSRRSAALLVPVTSTSGPSQTQGLMGVAGGMVSLAAGSCSQ